ncbi:hypothetical protein Goarm_020075 [Gossypium armourianum]|uniref:BED-type domain-containing protein n=1 Tax=Gossypium armourianum TaxID=34283 RepID=A0A7J9ING8_9ROSI|nr:hypothetical protein [Gossypium armourianum]
MSYNSKQGHYSYSCTDSSSPMAVIERNEISNAQDTTHERPTPKYAECLDDIEELTVVKFADGTEKVQCNYCKIKLAKNKDGTTTQYKRHLNGWVKCQASLKGQGNLFQP